MKKWVWFLIFSTTSFANTLPLPPGATALSPLEHLEVLEIKKEYKEICYKTCIIQEFKKIKLRFTLYGCMDELGPVSYKVKYRSSSDDYFLYLSAINIHMKASETVRCFLPKTEVADIWVDSKVNQDNLVISFLNFSTKTGLSGLGPIRLMSPIRILTNCGISSM